MADDFDLDAYFARIGYGGAARADLETLSALHVRHVAAIPFESLNPLAGLPVKLDLASLQAKMVAGRRGGYCFEQNHLFRAALEAIGFQVTGLGGRVVWMSAPDAPLGPLGHMLLKVEVDGRPWLADVGFGAHLLDAPLRLEEGIEQATPAATYQLLQREASRLALTARQGDGWRRAYLFDLTAQLPVDYEVANWFMSTYPGMIFANMLLAERLTEAARFNLINTRLTERRRDGTVTERALQSADELAGVLDEVFDIEPPIPAAEVSAKIAGP
ncbi:MAG TPA: arylamine N-acetyltransferase [Caulobacteraceae bacterium]|jgi:N-hydroxyarylamine O-acetyltransferase